LRLAAELPRFAHPSAVVILFSPLVFDRNLDSDHPWFDTAMRLHRASAPPLRLAELARRLFAWRSDAAIADGVARTRAVLRATIVLARVRGAPAVILVPWFTPEDPRETALRKRILDDAGLPYLPVPLDGGWRLPHDRHPDARAAQAIAAALVKALRK